MPERDALALLWNHFYEHLDPSDPSPPSRPGCKIPWFRSESGKLVLPSQADPAEMQRHRDRLIGRNFRFTWPYLPDGAHYVATSRVLVDEKER